MTAASPVMDAHQSRLVGGMINGHQDPDMAERVLLYASKGGVKSLEDAGFDMEEPESSVRQAVLYLSETGLVRMNMESGVFALVGDAKNIVDAHFRQRFAPLKMYVLDFQTGPVEAGRILDTVRSLPGSDFVYKKRFSLPMADLKPLQEEVGQRVGELQRFEREWLRKRLGTPYPVEHSGLTHVERNDPYWNDHTGRPEDDEEFSFYVQFSLGDMTGQEIINFKVDEVCGNLPPYHNFRLARGPSSEGQDIYGVRVPNPFSHVEKLYRPIHERNEIEARSVELKELIDSLRV